MFEGVGLNLWLRPHRTCSYSKPDGKCDEIHQEAELRKEADEEMERKRQAIAEEQKKKLEDMLAAQAQEYAAKQEEELAKAQKILEEEMSSAIDEYRTR